MVDAKEESSLLPCTKFSKVFGPRRRVLLPVIHYAGPMAAERSVAVAERAGADGVFFINQGCHVPDVISLAVKHRERFPFVGVNLLSIHREDVIEAASRAKANGVWADNGGVSPYCIGTSVASTDKARAAHPEILLMAGVAFKTQPFVPTRLLRDLAMSAAHHMDVVVTSGADTGVAAEPRRVEEMAMGLPYWSLLGLASGVTPGNVEQYLPWVNVYIVGTGIEKDFGILDLAKTKALADAVHGWTP